MREKIKALPRYLKTAKPINLNDEMMSLQKNTLAALGQTVMDALRTLQAAEIPVTTKTSKDGKKMAFSTAEDLESTDSNNSQYWIKDVHNFLNALKEFSDNFNALSKSGGQIDGADWERVKSRFYMKTKGTGNYGPNQEFYAAAHRILEGSTSAKDYVYVYNKIRGQFGNAIGDMMEGVLAEILNLPEIQDTIGKTLDEKLVKMAKAVVAHSGKHNALPGTIRFTQEIKFTEKRNSSPAATKHQGRRLADNLLTITPKGFGAEVKIGLNIKNLNFHSSFYGLNEGSIDIGSLKIGKFAPVFSNIKVVRDGDPNMNQRATSRGQYALYGYRALNANHEENSPVLMYLMSHRIAEIAFGTALDGSLGNDFSPLMSINGYLWNTADYILDYGAHLKVSTRGFPKGEEGLPDSWWMPENALNYVSQIHNANLRVQLSFGQQQAIQKFSK